MRLAASRMASFASEGFRKILFGVRAHQKGARKEVAASCHRGSDEHPQGPGLRAFCTHFVVLQWYQNSLMVAVLPASTTNHGNGVHTFSSRGAQRTRVTRVVRVVEKAPRTLKNAEAEVQHEQDPAVASSALSPARPQRPSGNSPRDWTCWRLSNVRQLLLDLTIAVSEREEAIVLVLPSFEPHVGLGAAEDEERRELLHFWISQELEVRQEEVFDPGDDLRLPRGTDAQGRGHKRAASPGGNKGGKTTQETPPLS